MASQIERLSPRTLLTLLAAACMTACAPVVAHGPRVEQGLTFYGTAGGTRTLCDRPACETNLIPQQGVGMRYGRAASASAGGWSAGFTLSTALVSSELDLYVQAPTSMGFDLGAGVLAAGSHGMPYVQAGRMRPDGSGWYTTQGFAFLSSRRPTWTYSLDGGTEERLKPRYWAPTVAYRTPGRHGMHLYVSGAFGTADAKKYRGEEPGFHTVRQPVRVVMIGAVFDVRPAHRSPRQVPPPPAPIPAVPPPAAAQPR
ncbi:MAG TPA: hypothetical protein VFR37_07150 [Longimicrobium sp.]|nr:hypothetical protein [Longimicrobium sp.]